MRIHFLARIACTGALLAATLVPAVAQAQPKTLRFVAHADVKILDPTFTTAYISRNFGYMVYDTLFAQDANGHPQPQMVDKYTTSKDGLLWTFTLRPGLKFSDGKAVTSADAVASIQRWASRDTFGAALKAAGARMVGGGREDLQARIEGAVRHGAGRAGQALGLSAGGDARAAGQAADHVADFRGGGLRPVSVQARRMAARQQDGVRAQSRLRGAQRAAQRPGRQQEEPFRPGRVAVPARLQQRRRRPEERRGRLHRAGAGRLHHAAAQRPEREAAVGRDPAGRS